MIKTFNRRTKEFLITGKIRTLQQNFPDLSLTDIVDMAVDHLIALGGPDVQADRITKIEVSNNKVSDTSDNEKVFNNEQSDAELVKAAKAAYMKSWRRNNKQLLKKYEFTYWLKKEQHEERNKNIFCMIMQRTAGHMKPIRQFIKESWKSAFILKYLELRIPCF